MVLYQLSVLPNIHTFEKVPTADPELSYAKNYQQVPVCLKEVKKITFKILVSGTLSTNVYVISTSFAKITALNGSFSCGM